MLGFGPIAVLIGTAARYLWQEETAPSRTPREREQETFFDRLQWQRPYARLTDAGVAVSRRLMSTAVWFGDASLSGQRYQEAIDWYKVVNDVTTSTDGRELNGINLEATSGIARGYEGLSAQQAERGESLAAIESLLTARTIWNGIAVANASNLTVRASAVQSAEYAVMRLRLFKEADILNALSNYYHGSEAARGKGANVIARTLSSYGFELASIARQNPTVNTGAVEGWYGLFSEQMDSFSSKTVRGLSQYPPREILTPLYHLAGYNAGEPISDWYPERFIRWVRETHGRLILAEELDAIMADALLNGRSMLYIVQVLSEKLSSRRKAATEALRSSLGNDPFATYLFNNFGSGRYFNPTETGNVASVNESYADGSLRSKDGDAQIKAFRFLARAYAAYSALGAEEAIRCKQKAISLLIRMSPSVREQAIAEVANFTSRIEPVFPVIAGGLRSVTNQANAANGWLSGVDSSAAIDGAVLGRIAGDIGFVGETFVDFVDFAIRELGYYEVSTAFMVATEAKVPPAEFQERVASYLANNLKATREVADHPDAAAVSGYRYSQNVVGLHKLMDGNPVMARAVDAYRIANGEDVIRQLSVLDSILARVDRGVVDQLMATVNRELNLNIRSFGDFIEYASRHGILSLVSGEDCAGKTPEVILKGIVSAFIAQQKGAVVDAGFLGIVRAANTYRRVVDNDGVEPRDPVAERANVAGREKASGREDGREGQVRLRLVR